MQADFVCYIETQVVDNTNTHTRKIGEHMKTTRLVPFLVGALAIGASSAAMAGGLNVGINVGIPAPVYVAPAPVYAPPPPPPPPVVYQPAPVIVGGPAIYIGWHGDRYWDGRRYWNRNDWYRYHGGYRGGYHDHGHGNWH
jgi:hypothetical protein